MLNERGLKVLNYAIRFNRQDIINNIIEINNISINEYLIANKIQITKNEIENIIYDRTEIL